MDAATLRIVVATDNHLGFMERDPVRGGDSFAAFEEVLRHAQVTGADMVLLGGDLFHDNKPSRSTMVRTVDMLNKYVMGDRPSEMMVLSDGSVNFPKTKKANFEDPNFNVQMPVFIIHGNHDDPAGTENISALDVLSSARLLNYFGKSDLSAGGGSAAGVGKIPITPVLIAKGDTRLALYGLGNVRDERLSRVFLQQGVTWMQPQSTPDCPADRWLNLMTIHQNRTFRGTSQLTGTGAIDERWLPNWLDLVVWGHEHECIVNGGGEVAHERPVGNGAAKTAMDETTFEVFQPGSSVAIQLSEGEAKPKHFMTIDVKATSYRTTYVPFRSVRPFVFETVALRDHADELDTEDPKSVEAFLNRRVAQILKDHAKAAETDMLPLVRLRVDHTGYTTVNTTRFGQQYLGKVANPGDILLFHKRRPAPSAGAGSSVAGAAAAAAAAATAERGGAADVLDRARVDGLVKKNLKADLEVMDIAGLSDALNEYVAKNETDAITNCVTGHLDKLLAKLGSSGALATEKEIAAAAAKAAKVLRRSSGDDNDDMEDGSGAPAAPAAAPATAPSPARKAARAPAGKAARAPAASPARKKTQAPPRRSARAAQPTKRSRAAAALEDDDDDDDDSGDDMLDDDGDADFHDDGDGDDDGGADDDDENEEEEPAPRRGRGRPAQKKKDVKKEVVVVSSDDDEEDGGVRSTRFTQKRTRRL